MNEPVDLDEVRKRAELRDLFETAVRAGINNDPDLAINKMQDFAKGLAVKAVGDLKGQVDPRIDAILDEAAQKLAALVPEVAWADRQLIGMLLSYIAGSISPKVPMVGAIPYAGAL